MNNKRMFKTHQGYMVIVFLVLLFSIGYSNQIKANSSPLTPQGTQLAYFIGYHSYSRNPAVIHVTPVQPIRGAYWTRWSYIGYSCQRSCLIDKWTGLTIQCRQRC
ncbi:hypothetical protein [Legionella quateirensis]|uniref:Uncharacterized protein n=1 Tax=Legionella quateirensis TaxID=45072 RepID=A0A378KVR8_9GAMM|nr:hypothetical protein [Legionella quateirensis]KTD51072.1 hypothetical protein Lqua_1299 [Legionella quateirensis]STY17681.1 Uncharacterised protein [Legionella quateirensis]